MAGEIAGEARGHADPVVWLHTPIDPRSIPATLIHEGTYTAYIPKGLHGRTQYFGLDESYAYAGYDPVYFDSPYWSFATEYGMAGQGPSFWGYPYTMYAHGGSRGEFWDEAKTYKAGDVVTVPNSPWQWRSLRDGNLNHRPGNSIPSGQAYTQQYADQSSLAPDWWQWLGGRNPVDAMAPQILHAASGWFSIYPGPIPSGGTNWKGWFLENRGGCWAGRAIEAGRQVGADHWASGECQCDNIGPGVRCNAETEDAYHTATTYVAYEEDDPEYEGSRHPSPAGAHKGNVTLYRKRNGYSTPLLTWSNVGVERFGGPWCVKLAAQTVNGMVVLSVWWRVWGYDPYERDLDVDPWRFLGSYTDASPDAIFTGQPGYVTAGGSGIAPPTTVSEGMFWWGWGEIDPASPRAPVASYVLAAESDRATADVSLTEVGYAAKTLSIDPPGLPVDGVLVLTGQRGPGSVVTLSPTAGDAGVMEYPTATTWRCVVSGLA